jgi:tRNA A22 N-methylase
LGKNATHANKKGKQTARCARNEAIKKSKRKPIEQAINLVSTNRNSVFITNRQINRIDETLEYSDEVKTPTPRN